VYDFDSPTVELPVVRHRRDRSLVKVVVLVVGLALVVGAALWLQVSAPGSARTGDCVRIVDVQAADIDKVDCASPEALYKVALARDDDETRCPSPIYLAYVESGSNELLLCLSLNARTGECFQVAENTYRKVGCDSPRTSFRVTKVVPGKADKTECGEQADDALVYPQPRLTICRAAPDTAAK
jgi:hypothetical protein